MYKKLVSYFFQGLFYLAPLAVTVYILYKIIMLIDGIMFEYIKINIPGIGLLLLIAGITLLGFLTDVYLARPVIELIQGIISKIPIVKEFYSPLKEIIDSVAGKNRKFSKPVLVKMYPNTNIEKIGFIMQENLTDLNIPGNKIAVYLPHSYAFSGELLIVSSENVVPLDIPSSVALKLILSGGAIKKTI